MKSCTHAFYITHEHKLSNGKVRESFTVRTPDLTRGCVDYSFTEEDDAIKCVTDWNSKNLRIKNA